MSYLFRPILEVKPNWLTGPVEEFDYDLRGIRRGFGSSTYAPTQRMVVRGWSMDFTFGTAQEFADFSTFTAARTGKLDGFWFPNLALQWFVLSATSDTVFDIKTQNLAQTWTDDSSVHLYVVKPDGTTIALAVVSVNSPSAGVERVTVATSLGATPDSTWRFYRLLYVRLADDVERSVAHTEGVYTQSVKVVELPEEYAGADTGQRPVYLYDFWQDNGDSTEHHWRYTSFAAQITSAGDVFEPFNLTHGSHKQSTKADRSEISIDAVWHADAPWALQLPFPSTRPLNLNLYEVNAPLPSLRTLYFAGECSGPEFDGAQCRLPFDHWFDAVRRQFPGRTIQPRCHYHLYDPLTCKAVAASHTDPDFELIISMTVQSDTTVTVTATKFGTDPGDYPTDFFAGGWIRVGTEPAIEERMIVASGAASGGAVVLKLSQRFVHQTVPVAGIIRRGCDRFYSTCKDVFGNEINFPGFVDVPRVNPTIKAIEVASGTAGKK
jgi:hypothetical protein